MTKVLIHGSGHKATSWQETITYLESNEEVYCPNLGQMIKDGDANYINLYSSFVEYCNKINGQIHLCGISLGGF